MSWQHDAACVGKDPELFFPIGADGPALDQTQQARQVCAGCAVQCLCLEWAMLTGINDGVWGGLTENERRTLQRDLRRQHKSAAGTAR